MANVQGFKALEEQNLEILETCFKDREVYRRLGGMLPLRKWYGSYENPEPDSDGFYSLHYFSSPSVC